MRSSEKRKKALFSYVKLEERIPARHAAPIKPRRRPVHADHGRLQSRPTAEAPPGLSRRG